ncbi:hypothetical protein J6590_018192 [Homalodisca vitripennis]|nr:hypothetical protein J6590_018192 [Homalodisca vitripennis]
MPSSPTFFGPIQADVCEVCDGPFSSTDHDRTSATNRPFCHVVDQRSLRDRTSATNRPVCHVVDQRSLREPRGVPGLAQDVNNRDECQDQDRTSATNRPFCHVVDQRSLRQPRGVPGAGQDFSNQSSVLSRCRSAESESTARTSATNRPVCHVVDQRSLREPRGVPGLAQDVSNQSSVLSLPGSGQDVSNQSSVLSRCCTNGVCENREVCQDQDKGLRQCSCLLYAKCQSHKPLHVVCCVIVGSPWPGPPPTDGENTRTYRESASTSALSSTDPTTLQCRLLATEHNSGGFNNVGHLGLTAIYSYSWPILNCPINSRDLEHTVICRHTPVPADLVVCPNNVSRSAEVRARRRPDLDTSQLPLFCNSVQ